MKPKTKFKIDMQIYKVTELQNTHADAIDKNLTKVDVLNQVPVVNDLKTIMIEKGRTGPRKRNKD